MATNPNLLMSLDEAVAEVLGMLTGLDLQYQPEQDRYYAVVRAINRALRSVARDHQWSFYFDDTVIGTVVAGDQSIQFSLAQRPRQKDDDAVRLVHAATGHTVEWAYFTPRGSLHKYVDKAGLWCEVVRNTLRFNRPFFKSEEGYEIHAPMMREPDVFTLPQQPEDPNEPLVDVPDALRTQQVDFDYPDLVVLKAAFFYAQSDPVMQPRVQILEDQYKDLMYQLMEQDSDNTELAYSNTFRLPLINGLVPSRHRIIHHPHQDGY